MADKIEVAPQYPIRIVGDPAGHVFIIQSYPDDGEMEVVQLEPSQVADLLDFLEVTR